MNMKVDIYKQENTQNPNTGSIERHWEYIKTVRCLIEPSKSSGTSTSADGKQFTNGVVGYRETMQLRGKFITQLSKRWRISNIKSSDNELIFNQVDLNNSPPTVFEVVSCHPMTDPFGRFSHYDVTLERVNIQSNDTGSS
jgi:hypothetical protein